MYLHFLVDKPRMHMVRFSGNSSNKANLKDREAS